MDRKFTKADLKVMNEHDKQFDQQLRIVAKNAKWKTRDWSSFKAFDDLFFSTFVRTDRVAALDGYLGATISLRVKPLYIDEIYWEVFNLEDNKKLPLSHRAVGVFVVQGPDLLNQYELTLKREPSEKNILTLAEKCFSVIDKAVSEYLERGYDASNFDVELFEDHNSCDKILIKMLQYINLKEYDKTLVLVETEKSDDRNGRYHGPNGGIYDYVERYCKERM